MVAKFIIIRFSLWLILAIHAINSDRYTISTDAKAINFHIIRFRDSHYTLKFSKLISILAKSEKK